MIQYEKYAAASKKTTTKQKKNIEDTEKNKIQNAVPLLRLT